MAGERRWQVRPDHEVFIGGEIVAAVSREAMVQAYMDAEAMQAISGGIVTCIVGRRKTDLAGEAVTTGAIFEWKPGLRVQHGAPEAELDVLPAQPLDDPEPDELEEALAREELEANGTAGLGEARAAHSDDPDGDALARLEEEDLSAIPETLR